LEPALEHFGQVLPEAFPLHFTKRVAHEPSLHNGFPNGEVIGDSQADPVLAILDIYAQEPRVLEGLPQVCCL